MQPRTRSPQSEMHAPDLPELDLWHAALSQFIEDARIYATTGKDQAGYRRAAFQDLIHDGPMLRRLSGFALVDPELVRAVFLRSLPRGRIIGGVRCKVGKLTTERP